MKGRFLRGASMGFASRHLRHHGRFYVALFLGALAYVSARPLHSPLPETIAGDIFFLSYLLMSGWLLSRLTASDLANRANIEDEGVPIVVAIMLAAITATCVGIFVALGRGTLTSPMTLLASIAGAPLAWFMLHTVMTFHYANLHYGGLRKKRHVLEFPGTEKPGPWDFIYFSFVIGMTAQTSDTLVKDSVARRTVTLHGIVSFFFNTVLIALAVNAVVAGVH